MDTSSYSSNLLSGLLRLKIYLNQQNYKSFHLIVVSPDYYQKTLQERQQILRAPSPAYLCKSMIMENTAFKPEFQSRVY